MVVSAAACSRFPDQGTGLTFLPDHTENLTGFPSSAFPGQVTKPNRRQNMYIYIYSTYNLQAAAVVLCSILLEIYVFLAPTGAAVGSQVVRARAPAASRAAAGAVAVAACTVASHWSAHSRSLSGSSMLDKFARVNLHKRGSDQHDGPRSRARAASGKIRRCVCYMYVCRAQERDDAGYVSCGMTDYFACGPAAGARRVRPAALPHRDEDAGGSPPRGVPFHRAAGVFCSSGSFLFVHGGNTSGLT